MSHTHPHSNQNYTRMTIDFPIIKHKKLKAIAALLGIPMKDFILTCVLEKLDDKKILATIEEQQENDAFDRGMKSIQEKGYDTLEDVKHYLGMND